MFSLLLIALLQVYLFTNKSFTGAVSPSSESGNVEINGSLATNEEVAKLAAEMTTLTDKLEEEPVDIKVESEEPSQEDVNAAVAQLNMSIGDDDG